MSSINQLISEIAHSIQQADSVPVRRAIRLSIIHARNEAIRKSYNNHSITDKVLQQRIKLSVVDVKDGDLYNPINTNTAVIKRTKYKVPKPTRLTNNLPFHSVRTVGVKNPIEIAFVKEASVKFYDSLPCMCSLIVYDYINGYIYVSSPVEESIAKLDNIIIESVFEQPHIIEIETEEGIKTIDDINDDDEFLLPEDMIGFVKKLVLETFNGQILRDTNETPTNNLIK